ncbi:hypothetical protein Tco_0463182, partial [Tanacetum coccineum]
PWKGVVRFGNKGKLAPRLVGPFEIIENVGLVAHRHRWLEELNGVHDTFHVSNLKKCLADPTLQVPLDEIQVDAKLNFVKEPVEILERDFKKLKRSKIAIVKVRWNSKCGPEFTPLGAYDLGVATPRALVYAGVMTSGDARSLYMISEDAKSWGEVNDQIDVLRFVWTPAWALGFVSEYLMCSCWDFTQICI